MQQLNEVDVRLAEALTPVTEQQSAHGTCFLIPSEVQEPYPNGFWRSRTVSGRDSGLGFYCWQCHLLIQHDAPREIRHCGGVEMADRKTNLIMHRLGSHVVYTADPVEEQVQLKRHEDLLAERKPIMETIAAWFNDLLQKGS